MKKLYAIVIAASLALAVPERLPAQTAVAMQTCEYWFDYDFESRVSQPVTDGTFRHSFDVSSMSPGVHSVSVRFGDDRGLWTAPFLKHFVIPAAVPATASGISGYDYWFNSGPRVSVAVEKQTPLTVSDVTVEVRDVVPNAITEDYRFDAASGTVAQPDIVTIGIQAFDDLGTPSQAVVSEGFAFDVVLSPDFVSLEEGDGHEFAAPSGGRMQGFRLKTQNGDDVRLRLTDGARLDMYDGDGRRLDVGLSDDGVSGAHVYSAKAAGPTTFALVWNAPAAMAVMRVDYLENGPSGMAGVAGSSDGVMLRIGRGELAAEAKADGRLTVVSASGVVMGDDAMTAGSTTAYALSPGVYIIKFDGRIVSKVAVR